jgi:chromosome segregation ATPase
MIEPIMYFGIGFLVASLLGLLLIPLVHNRAVRLTMRRLEAATPVSMAEIHAEKDQLRAEFAMATRRLELSVEQLTARTSSQLAELGKKADAINRLKAELAEKKATVFALETREKTLKEQLRTTEDELTAKTAMLRETERSLASATTELKGLMTDFGEHSLTADSQRVELAALRAQAEALKDKVAQAEHAMKQTVERLERERAAAEEANKELAAERLRVENLTGRTAQLERQLIIQTTETEILGRRVHELEGRLADQGRLLAEREYECDRLRGLAEAARKAGGRSAAAPDDAPVKAMARAAPDRAQEDRAQAQREASASKREAEATLAAERAENALMRERITNVAAEVARLTAALEGPGSPIEAILAASASLAPAGGNGPNAPEPRDGDGPLAGRSPDPSEPTGTLADRIRALQTRAARVSTRN